MSFYKSILKFHSIILGVLFALSLEPSVVFASEQTSTSNSSASQSANDKDIIGMRLCDIIKTLQGRTTKGIAMIAVIMLSVGAFTGRMQWTTVMVTLIGIVIIFQAGYIVDLIAGISTAKDCGI